MIFYEQVLRKQKLYYHGSRNEALDKNYSHFDWFFISSDITTAILYCKKTEDDIKYIHTFKLKKYLNVFNALSKIDYERLRKAFLRKGKLDFVNKEMYKLKKQDWLQLKLKSNVTRQDIVNTVEDLGYDGFFNFEWGTSNPHPNVQHDKASIGLFGNIEDKLEFCGVQPLSQLKTPKFDKICLSDIEQAEYALEDLNAISSSKEDFLQRATIFFSKNDRYYSTLTQKDFLEIANEVFHESSLNTLTESEYEENRMRKAKEIGLEIPPEKLIRI